MYNGQWAAIPGHAQPHARLECVCSTWGTGGLLGRGVGSHKPHMRAGPRLSAMEDPHMGLKASRQHYESHQQDSDKQKPSVAVKLVFFISVKNGWKKKTKTAKPHMQSGSQ